MAEVETEIRKRTKTAAEIGEEYKKFIGRKLIFILALIPVLFLITGVSTSLGSANITVWDAYSAIFHRFFPNYFTTSWLADICVWHLRLPRIALGIAAGIGLGVAGSVFQGVLRNPLASPYTLGISSGAGFGASLAILAGAGIVGGQYLIIGNAFVFALLCAFIIIGLSSRRGAAPETMILAGIALMYLFGALTTLLQYFAEAEAVKEAVFWMVGDLGKASWSIMLPVSIAIVCCIPLLIFKSWDLNVLGSGDETAKSLGVKVAHVRIFTMIVGTFLVATIVCFTGTIGFIGLVAPHMCRMVIGGDNRFLLPASGLSGAVLLTLADTVARRIIAPVILPVGVVTAFMGAPLFLYLILRKRRREYW
ncbi:iron ABC transporter permease [Methanophagales archaeon]|nr:MAG: iron ABC transporter permease [Methanophagales archaeon]